MCVYSLAVCVVRIYIGAVPSLFYFILFCFWGGGCGRRDKEGGREKREEGFCVTFFFFFSLLAIGVGARKWEELSLFLE
jgi:NADH:ubiquinone oxidoreductase subunit 6 (subunit J)